MSQREIPIAIPETGDEEWLALRETLQSGWLTQGPKVKAFETKFAQHHQSQFALATTSCTTALHLILVALGIKPGDEVIVPAFTWVATANVVLYCGATPVFVDIDPQTYNITADGIKQKITEKTKAIIVVHLFGQCADVDAIANIAKDIPIIEDAACCAGATYKGRSAGTLGIAGAFSFHPRKIMTTGEGGMITTQDKMLADKMNCLRNHGASISEEQRHQGNQPYLLPDFNVLGFNYRMTDLQACVGLVQLEKLTRFVTERSTWAKFYCEQLQEIPWLKTPFVLDHAGHSWQAFVCQIDFSKIKLTQHQVMDYLLQRGIQTRPGTHAVISLNYYREKLAIDPHKYPNAIEAEASTLALPLHNRMTEDDYHFVVNCLKNLTQEIPILCAV